LRIGPRTRILRGWGKRSICLCFTYTQKKNTKLRNQENTSPDPKIALRIFPNLLNFRESRKNTRKNSGFCESGQGPGFYADGEKCLFAYVLPIHRKNMKKPTKLRNQENTGPDPKIAPQIFPNLLNFSESRKNTRKNSGFWESGQGPGFYADGEKCLFAYVLPIHRKTPQNSEIKKIQVRTPKSHSKNADFANRAKEPDSTRMGKQPYLLMFCLYTEKTDKTPKSPNLPKSPKV